MISYALSHLVIWKGYQTPFTYVTGFAKKGHPILWTWKIITLCSRKIKFWNFHHQLTFVGTHYQPNCKSIIFFSSKVWFVKVHKLNVWERPLFTNLVTYIMMIPVVLLVVCMYIHPYNCNYSVAIKTSWLQPCLIKFFHIKSQHCDILTVHLIAGFVKRIISKTSPKLICNRGYIAWSAWMNMCTSTQHLYHLFHEFSLSKVQ